MLLYQNIITVKLTFCQLHLSISHNMYSSKAYFDFWPRGPNHLILKSKLISGPNLKIWPRGVTQIMHSWERLWADNPRTPFLADTWWEFYTSRIVESPFSLHISTYFQTLDGWERKIIFILHIVQQDIGHRRGSHSRNKTELSFPVEGKG